MLFPINAIYEKLMCTSHKNDLFQQHPALINSELLQFPLIATNLIWLTSVTSGLMTTTSSSYDKNTYTGNQKYDSLTDISLLRLDGCNST